MCSLSKEQSILSRETIKNAFFFPFSSIKHPTAERWHLHAVLLINMALDVATISYLRLPNSNVIALVDSVDEDQTRQTNV